MEWSETEKEFGFSALSTVQVASGRNAGGALTMGTSVLPISCKPERSIGAQVVMLSGIVGQVTSRWLVTRCPREGSDLRGWVTVEALRSRSQP